ncbi:MAG: phage tail tape measure protein [Amaricoccus sp.]
MAFDQDGERLFVTLEARINDFEKQMRKAERTGTGTYENLQKRSSRATKAMEQDMVRSTGRINQALAATSSKIGAFAESFEGLGRAAGKGGLIAGAITAIAAATLEAGKKVNELAGHIAEIGDKAKMAGLSAGEFQKWAYVASQNRIEVDALADGLKELSLRADEFVTTGGGSAAESFQRLGFTADELRDKLRDPSDLFLEIIDRLGDLDNNAAQIRIMDEVFGGTGGEKFVQLIEQGRQGIERTRDEAVKLGAVMDDDLIAKADDLNKMFGAVATTVGSGLKNAIISASAALYDFINSFREFQSQTDRQIANQRAAIIRERADLESQLRTAASGEGLTENAKRLGFGPDSPIAKHEAEALQARIAELSTTQAKIDAVIADRKGQFGPNVPPGGLPKKPVQGPDLPAGWTPPKVDSTPPSTGGGGGSAAADRPDDLERATAQIQKRTAALQAETEAQAKVNPLVEDYGFAATKAKAAQELLTAAQQAGVKITPELAAQIGELAGAYATASAESKRLDESQADAAKSAQALAGLKQDVTRGLIEGLREGTDAATLLSQALTKVADYYLDLALKGMFQPTAGGGAGGGILGAIVSALGSVFGFADGGYTGPGGRNDPAGIVHAGEYVFSKQAVEAIGAGRLEAMHRSAKRGYADGGAVGRAASPAAGGTNIKIVNTLDSADVLDHALSTERGQKVLLNHVSSNARRIKAALS